MCIIVQLCQFCLLMQKGVNNCQIQLDWIYIFYIYWRFFQMICQNLHISLIISVSSAYNFFISNIKLSQTVRKLLHRHWFKPNIGTAPSPGVYLYIYDILNPYFARITSLYQYSPRSQYFDLRMQLLYF